MARPVPVIGTKSRRVTVELVELLESFLYKVADYVIALGSIEVDRRAPGRVVTVREVRPKFGQVVSLGPKMVVDHIQHHGEPHSMAFIHQALQGYRSSIAGLRGKRIYAVVSPIALLRELRHRHQFEGGDPKILQTLQPWSNRIERTLLREGPHVNLIKDIVVLLQSGPTSIGPRIIALHDQRRSVYPLRLVTGNWIGALDFTIQPVPIAAVFLAHFGAPVEISELLRLKRYILVAYAFEADLHAFSTGSPNQKFHRRAVHPSRAEVRRECLLCISKNNPLR